jgi:hypothetical protein
MELQVKETIWRKIHLKPSVTKEDLMKFFENNNVDDIYDSELYDGENELLIDTTTLMQDPSFSQDGFSTVELWNDNHKIIWADGKY